MAHCDDQTAHREGLADRIDGKLLAVENRQTVQKDCHTVAKSKNPGDEAVLEAVFGAGLDGYAAGIKVGLEP